VGELRLGPAAALSEGQEEIYVEGAGLGLFRLHSRRRSRA